MNDKWTIGSILAWTKQYFEGKGVDNPRLDAEVLLSSILGKDRLYLYVNFEQPLEQEELTAFRAFVKRRALRLPVAYITGCKEFMGLKFAVSPAVLIPRPDTEILVETALGRLAGQAGPQVLDIGTGSGAIIISVLNRLPAATGTAVDVSAEALAMAGKNAVSLGVAARLSLEKGDLFSPVAGQEFDAILSNPPYIETKDLEGLSPEVCHEPRLALDGGADGLECYRRLLGKAAQFLKPAGFLALEIGVGQAAAIAKLADAESGLKTVEVIKDYGGIERVLVIERR